MSPRLVILVIVHLALGVFPLVGRFVPPDIRYLPIFWMMGVISVAQAMLLAFWLGMGNGSWQCRLGSTLLGCGYQGASQTTYNQDISRILAFMVIVLLLSSLFFAMRRWFTLQRITPSTELARVPGRFQFTILHLLVLTSVVAVIVGLVRNVRLANTPDSVWSTVMMYALFLATFTINAVCATWATLNISAYRAKVAAIFGVSSLLGIALSLSMTRNIAGNTPLLWWQSLAGPFITLSLTLMIVASLWVVRSCGYRLVPRTTLILP